MDGNGNDSTEQETKEDGGVDLIPEEPELQPVVESEPEIVELVNEEGEADSSNKDQITIEESSIIEMEVDDSNTGDTITSNPEIDLGSAAAAATAVITEEGDKEEGQIVIISTESIAELPPGSSGVSGPFILDLPEESAVEVETENDNTQQTQSEDVVLVTEAGTTSPVTTVAVAELKSEETYLDAQDTVHGPREDDLVEAEAMEMEINEEEEIVSFPPTQSNIEATLAIPEPTAGIPIEEMEQEQYVRDSMDSEEPEAGFDSEHLHHEIESIPDEDSMSSLPEDVTETDKENNGAERDLVEEDENDDDDTYLEITRRRTSQDREGNCYCGKDRNFNIAELLCASCYRWFHESCISYQLGKLVPFTTNYVFTCKNCSPTGLECFRRNQAQFSQMCVTALANLTQASAKEGKNDKLFSKDRDIIPFFEMHWEALTTTTRRVTQSWHSTVTKTLLRDAGTVYITEDKPGDELSPYFGLESDDLSQIRPNYEAMIKSGQLKITDQKNCSSSLRGRGAKRRTVLDPSNVVPNTINKKPRGDSFGPKPTIGHGYPTEHPFNKDSYRYILAEPDPNAPFRQEFDESNEWSGKPIHGWLCRVVNPPSVLLALHDRAPQLKISDDRLSVTGEKGYCMIRATHGVTRGSWYFEAKITDMPEGSATRIGFCQQFGNLQGPLGFDRYGYSWRSRYGTAFHEAKGKSFAKGGYGLDDVLGFLIVMPEAQDTPLVPTSFKDRPLVKVKSHLYYEDKDDPKELDNRETRNGSKIMCFKNGVYQGVAFEDMFCGTYYPAISLYKSITVRVNFGPEFEAPPSDHEYRGMNERAEDSVIGQTVADLMYLTENEGKLRLDNAVPLPL